MLQATNPNSDELQNIARAAGVTAAQVKLAIQIVGTSWTGDTRAMDSTLLAGVIQALATNYAAIVRK